MSLSNFCSMSRSSWMPFLKLLSCALRLSSKGLSKVWLRWLSWYSVLSSWMLCPLRISSVNTTPNGLRLIQGASGLFSMYVG